MDPKEAKSELEKLAKEAQEHHKQVRLHLINALDHARQCGEILIRAKELVKHGQWKRWLNRNFPASYETAADYMIVARYWNADCLVEARQEGYIFTSIKSVLDFVREKRAEEWPKNKKKDRYVIPEEPPTRPLTKRQKKAAIARCNLQRTFEYHLKSLTIDEVLMFERIFNLGCTEWWDALVEKLHHMVCCELEHDPYDHTVFIEYLDSLCKKPDENRPEDYNVTLDQGYKWCDYIRRVGGDMGRCERIFKRDQKMKELARRKVHKVLNKE